jgi:hypothetical protein
VTLLHPGANLVLTVDRLDHDGAGVADVQTDSGLFRLHVAGALPGEHVRARVAHVSPHAREQGKDAWADLEEIATASLDRVASPCPAHDRCGSCPLARWAYAAQVEWKRELVVEAMATQRELSRGEPASFAGGAPSRAAEREGASAASGCGGEGAGPEVPEGGSERGVVAGGGPKGGANPLRVPIAVKGKEWATQAQEIDAAPRRPTKTEFVAFPPKRESSRLAPTPNASKQASQRWGRSSAQLRIKCENAG